MLFLGFDNGTTSKGIGVVGDKGHKSLIKLPTKRELSYTKQGKYITRINTPALMEELRLVQEIADKEEEGKVFVGLERPMVNSTRFNASLSAVRTLEATLIALEALNMAYEYYDSKQWQRVMLPKNTIGSKELKKASLDIGKRLFPELNVKGDADGLLLAEYMRRHNKREL